MKILTAQQQKDADTYTIKHEPVSSIDLMERATSKCIEWLTGRYDTSINFMIICGLGNNGGDGLAIARMLANKNYKVSVNILRYSEKCSDDFLANEKELKKIKSAIVKECNSSNDIETVTDRKTVIIDAIFGIGLNKAIEGWVGEVVDKINASGCPVVAIDVPSGLFSEENSSSEKRKIIRADITLTFHSPKLSFMFASNSVYVGEFVVLDIGLHKDIIASLPSSYHYVVADDIKQIYYPRKKFTHKGTYGRALLVAGSYGKIGAAVLSASACLRSGVGLLTAHVPKCGYEIIQTSVPEAMVSIDSDEKFITDNIHLEKYNAIGIGPGLAAEKQTQNILKVLIQNAAVPMVLDADALNILSENKTWLSFLRKGTILTPHPKEFDRLTGLTLTPEDRFKEQLSFSRRYNVYVVLKGAHTSITCPDGEVYFNSTGNPGMATAGSGDVLTGIITSLLAQGYDPKQASIMGVYLHGFAGDAAAQKKSQEGMIASDIIENIGQLFLKLNS